MEEGTFPKCLKLGSPIKDPRQFDCRAIAWIEDEIDQWVESRIKERDLRNKNLPNYNFNFIRYSHLNSSDVGHVPAF